LQNGKQMKPVAWAIKSDNDFTEIGFDNDLLKEVEEMYAMEGWKYEVVPLYTAPRELSDEEINKLWTDSYDFNGRFCVYEFAKAILKKAREHE
jgi:hypothetical protein